MMQGEIRTVKDTFGFITTNNGRDLFFPANEVRESAFTNLSEGQIVEFELGRNHVGPMACNVRPIKADLSRANGNGHPNARPAPKRHNIPFPLEAMQPILLRIRVPGGLLIVAYHFVPTDQLTANHQPTD